jgi:hypothetical protein
MPLQHIEIFDLANHLGNYDLIGEGRTFAHVCFVVRYSSRARFARWISPVLAM